MTAPLDLVVTGIGATLPPAGPGPSDVDWFDFRTQLDERGYKYVPRAAQMLLAAARRAFDDAARPRFAADEDSEGCGVALASNNCASRLHASIDDAVRSGGLNTLRPATAPFFSVNLFLSRLAIEHGLKGFSLALHTPRTAGLETFEVGERAVRQGRASWLVLGATEDPLADVEPESAGSDDGAVVFVAEPAGLRDIEQSYGSCVVRSLFVSPSGAADGVRERMRAALAAIGADVPGLPVRLVCDDSPAADAVAAALGGGTVDRELAGPGSLRPMAVVASLLRDRGEPAVVVGATATGNVALAAVTPN